MEMGLYFHEPKGSPKKMWALASGLEKKEWSPSDSVEAFPPKSVQDILVFIENGSFEHVSILDWITLFDFKDQWDSIHSDLDVAATSALIFKAIPQNAALTHLALFRALLTIDGSGRVFPEVLLEHLHFLKDYLDDASLELLNIALLARSGKFELIAKKAADSGLTVDSFYAKYHLPKCTNLKKKTVEALPHLVSSIHVTEYDNWLVAALCELQRADSIPLVEALLVLPVNSLSRCNGLVSWLDEYCHPRIEETIWFELTNSARSVLRKLIHVSEFYRFKQLVGLLRRDAVATGIGLDDKAKNQIRQRALFWEHYDSRMLSLRVLVSSTTKLALLESMAESSWLEILEDKDGSEVVIMEFDQHIVVEFLRGGTSEIRIFKKSMRNVNLLLKSKELSIKSIREAFYDDVHDHVFMWQWSCEAWLRNSFKIIPNDKVVTFKGLPPQANHYSIKSGLSKPDDDLIARRAEELGPWFDSFFEREKLLGKLGKSHGASARKYLLNGKRYGELGYFSKMADSFEKAANLGSSEAMYQLASYLLSGKPMSKEKRLEGELWLEKAAKAGHPKAVKSLSNAKLS
ncbi:EH signature domain-containing protein [Amphritea sp.]|uniref:EH signature domain-containing protein n=1 Tax=Amphritea sp. TaxID=1872502 RepID=UPI003A9168EC